MLVLGASFDSGHFWVADIIGTVCGGLLKNRHDLHDKLGGKGLV